MGERGPLPVPYARRRNKRGNRGKRIDVCRPEMPDSLSAEARAEWERVVPEIEAMGLLATVDRAALIRYCRAWQDWWEIDEKLRASGVLIRGRRDGLVRNPLWLLRSDAEAILSDLGKQLGLTPAARLRAGVEHEQEEPEDSVAPAAIAEYRKRLTRNGGSE
jgi:P27 family predicted phage terminase small subunit